MGLSPLLVPLSHRFSRALAALTATTAPDLGGSVASDYRAVTESLLQTGPITPATITVAGAVAILLLIGLSAFFSSSEIAMFSLAKHRVDSMVENGIPGAKTVSSLKDNPHRLLITILVGNNIVNIAMSSIATAIVGFYFDPGTAVLASTFGITTLV